MTEELTTDELIEHLVSKYGEQWRRLIDSSIRFVIEQEPKWGVSIDKEEYVVDLINWASGNKHKGEE